MNKISHRSYRVGDVELNPRVVNAKSLRELSRAAEESEAGKPRQVSQVVDRWLEQGQIDQKDFQTFWRFSKDAKDRYFELNREYWDKKKDGRDWKDPELKALELKMGKAADYLQHYEKVNDQLRIDTARTAVEAAAAASFSGPVGMVAAYAAWAHPPRWEAGQHKAVGELLTAYQGYLAGDSRMITEDNHVEQVHRENLWRSIHENLTLQQAIDSARSGEPVEVDMQYYELTSPEVVGKAAEAALAGNRLRVNVDPGRLSYPTRNPDGSQWFQVDDVPHKMRSVLQLAGLDADVGVTIFPPRKQLGDPENLMHRKVLRVGETVLLSGMNANDGSGENVDAGYEITGPAARQLVDNLKRDVRASAGAGADDIWGEEHFQRFLTEDLRVGRRGVAAMLDVIAGPSAAGADLPPIRNLGDLEKLAAKARVDIAKWFELPLDQASEAIARGELISLSREGKNQFRGIIERALEVTRASENVARATDIEPPEGKPAGKTRVDIADLPPERETLMLDAIAQAEQFIYIPGFVVTRAIAAALVARRDELEAQGKNIDIRVIADPGIYPDGSTPNYWGVSFLENHGITPRWAMLPRSGWHDRKIHAKQLITEKGELSGSTNFTNKGLRENWEESSFVHFAPKDKEAMKDRAETVRQFQDLWENESFELSSRDVAAYWKRYKPEPGKEWLIRDTQEDVIKKIIAGIEQFEIQSADWMAGQARDPGVARRIVELTGSGMAEGYATLLSVRESLGDEDYYGGLKGLPAARELQDLQEKVRAWKEREEARAA
ncbi:MAG: hypothetical protein HY319_32525 [Armatimonadetes bacterium]|nr:hypothetical protein [Armatimonadota bacterium]